MTRTRCTLAVLLLCALSAKSFAQVVVGMPIPIPTGIDFRYKKGPVRVSAFIPTGAAMILPTYPAPGYLLRPTYYPYAPYCYPAPIGVVERRATLTVTAPPVALVRRAAEPDLAGIDLDVEPASKIWGEKPALAKKAEKIGEAARIDPPPEKKLPPVAPPLPKPEPIPESRRLTDLGVEAFQKGEYNLAIRHFRQLAELSPLIARPLFLEAQALIAVGKYRDAVEMIERGLKRHPEWPSTAFRPKADLFDNDEATWAVQRKQLEEVHRANPKNADYRFLLGYLAWFDGQRDVAVEHFLEARASAPDAAFCDLFLKAAKK